MRINLKLVPYLKDSDLTSEVRAQLERNDEEMAASSQYAGPRRARPKKSKEWKQSEEDAFERGSELG